MKLCINLLFLLLGLSSCSKFMISKDNGEYECEKLRGFHKFVYEPIIIDDECQCIVAGKVKYLNDCETQALIYYGNGDCNNIATKIICKEGNCFDKNGNPHQTMDFEIECNGNGITDGQVDTNEIDDLFDPLTGPQP